LGEDNKFVLDQHKNVMAAVEVKELQKAKKEEQKATNMAEEIRQKKVG
jgi:hypothetical protein